MPETFSQDDSAESPAARFINPHRTPTFPPATRSTPVGKIDKGIGVYNFASPDTHARQQHHFLSSGMIFCCSKECVHAAAAHHLRTLCTLVTTIAQLAVARDSRISSRQLATARNSSQQLAVPWGGHRSPNTTKIQWRLAGERVCALCGVASVFRGSSIVVVPRSHH